MVHWLTLRRLWLQFQQTERCNTSLCIRARSGPAVVQTTHLCPSAYVPTRWYRWCCAAWSGCRRDPSRTSDSPRGNGRSPLYPSCGSWNWGWRCVPGPNAWAGLWRDGDRKAVVCLGWSTTNAPFNWTNGKVSGLTQQQVGEEKWAKVVGGKCHIQPIFGYLPGKPYRRKERKKLYPFILFIYLFLLYAC